MLNITDFSVLNANFPRRENPVPALCYGGLRGVYHVTKAEPGFYGYELHVQELDGDVSRTYACSVISVAIASIEALERGEEI